MGITNIDINYTPDDFQNLTTYKLFNQHIRPILLEKNPKLVMYKMVSVIGAKWREFIELREQYEAKNKPTSSSTTSNKETKSDAAKDSAAEDEKETKTETLASLAGQTADAEDTATSGRRRTARTKRTYDYEAEDSSTKDNEASLAADIEEEAYSTRRTSSRNKKANGSSSSGVKNQDESSKDAAVSGKKGAANNAKGGKKRKRKDGDDGGGGYNDSDAEFEAMLEEQCRIEENEKLKKKQRKEDRKAAAEQAAAVAAASTSRLVNSKNMPKKQAKIKNTGDAEDFDQDNHQDYCDVCQAGGEIILCDTCPKAFHLCCLEPELEEAPEGEWFCPQCEKDGIAAKKKEQNAEALAKAAVDSDGIQHFEYCTWCKDGGELILCETCPQAYHIDCLNPPLNKIPTQEWYCPRCSCPKLKGVIKKILTWRWKAEPEEQKKEEEEEEEETEKRKKKKPMLKIKLKTAEKKSKKAKESDNEDRDDEQDEDTQESKSQSDDDDDDEDEDEEEEEELEEDEEDDRKKNKKAKNGGAAQGTCKTLTTSYKKDPNQTEPVKHTPQRLREFFVKYDGLSYWHCDWVSEIAIEVHHKILWRYYTQRNDMESPPTSESLKENNDDENKNDEEDEDSPKHYDPVLEKNYYRNGVRPSYLKVCIFD